jgi:nicotinate dehydrogenase subunit B
MTLPPTITRTPALDRWLRFDPDGSVVVYTGKVEIGQGIKTAIAMIAADELDVALERIRVVTADTDVTPNEFVTAGSMSIQDSGTAVRIAAATARWMLLARAAEQLGASLDTLAVEDGLITSDLTNEQTDYWRLQGGREFGVEMIDMPAVKTPTEYRVVGHNAPRLDLPAKVHGAVAFVHDLHLPEQLHARLIKPPFMTARLASCPADFSMPGVVKVVRDGSFLGVVAEREEVAIAAAERLAVRCEWRTEPLTPAMGGVEQHLRSNVTRSFPVIDGTPVDADVPVKPAPNNTARVLNATYYRPYQMHGAMGPSAALARFRDGRLTVYSHSQGVELLKLALADALAIPNDYVHVVHAEGAGCYGHNGADDAALDAALLAMAVAPRPVMLKWTRADEHGFEPYAPATVIDMSASLDDAGLICDWQHEAYGFTHMGRPRPSPGHTNLQPAWWRERPIPPVPKQPLLMAEAGIHRNLEPIYSFKQQRLIKHFVADGPLRTSSTRSLGAFANVFAIESFMDELAHAAGRDPIEFRLAHLSDPRARTLLETLQDHAPEPLRKNGNGRGVALARYKNQQTYAAILIDLAVADDGEVGLQRAWIAADAGLVIDPDGLRNQLEGGFIQAASWALKESVTWDAERVTSRDWDSYPILSFSEVPQVETILIERAAEPPVGAGEARTGPTPAAIANAIFDAVAVRVRTIPFTPAQLRRAAATQ